MTIARARRWPLALLGLALFVPLVRNAYFGDSVIDADEHFHLLVAAAFVVATALVIATIARQLAGPVPAIVVALAYPLMLGWSGGMGGQSPVFYNLPMALAALLVLRQLEDRGRRGLHPRRIALLAFAWIIAA